MHTHTLQVHLIIMPLTVQNNIIVSALHVKPPITAFMLISFGFKANAGNPH
jgi:hypothetical protein